MMSDKTLRYIFKLLSQETGLLITKFPEDDTIINDLYEAMIFDDDDNDGLTACRNYITMLIKYCEQKEYYEKCAMLLKLKNKISEDDLK
jgi:hypothetical protein